MSEIVLKGDSLALYDVGGAGSIADLLELYGAVSMRADAIAATFSQVNVETTMRQLVHAGALLRVAYAAAGDTKSAPMILKLFSQHQSFVGDSVVVSASFVQGAIEALDNHTDALEALTGGDKAKVLRALARCATIATDMAEAADRTVKKAEAMETLSEEALVGEKTLSEEANLAVKRSYIGKAVKSLDICVQLMGQIKITFTNVRIFWESIASMCHSLSKYDTQRLDDMSLRGLAKYVERQMVQWVAIGHLNYLANKGIVAAKDKVDAGMNSLPTKSEADKILENDADDIAKMLQEEYRKIVILDNAASQELAV
jgi:hypothetical protein